MRPVLGAVLAGGASRRYGSPKARAVVGGAPMAGRLVRALRAHAAPVVLVGGGEELAESLGVETVADRRSAAGPLAGVEAVLHRARALDADGALVVACDLPLVPARLLGAIVERAREPGGDGRAAVDAVLPESRGPLGLEPLCGWYAPGALAAVEGLLDEGVRSMEEAAARLRVRRLPLTAVERIGPPDELFLNVNTPADRRRAEDVLATVRERR